MNEIFPAGYSIIGRSIIKSALTAPDLEYS